MDGFMEGVLTGLLSGFGGLFIYHIKFVMKTNERLTKIEVKITNICDRLEKIEKRLNNVDNMLRNHAERIARMEKSS